MVQTEATKQGNCIKSGKESSKGDGYGQSQMFAGQQRALVASASQLLMITVTGQLAAGWGWGQQLAGGWLG